DRTSLFYNDWGQGPPVVFLHGWALGAAMWEYTTLPLGRRGLRAIAYDRRGCGRSDHPAGGYDYDTFADDLAAVLDKLELRGVTLVAHSLAGGEVIRYLARHGAARVARVAFVCTTAPCLRRAPDNPDGVPPAAVADILAALETDR